MATKKTTAKAAAVPVPANDNITKLIGKVLPQYHDTDDYIDIVQWNLRWFNSKEPKRVDAIYKVLAQLNSDIYVFQEVADGYKHNDGTHCQLPPHTSDNFKSMN